MFHNKYHLYIYTSTFYTPEVLVKHFGSLLFQLLYSKLFLITWVVSFLAYVIGILTHENESVDI